MIYFWVAALPYECILTGVGGKAQWTGSTVLWYGPWCLHIDPTIRWPTVWLKTTSTYESAIPRNRNGSLSFYWWTLRIGGLELLISPVRWSKDRSTLPPVSIQNVSTTERARNPTTRKAEKISVGIDNNFFIHKLFILKENNAFLV